jgi:hypothetical protein
MLQSGLDLVNGELGLSGGTGVISPVGVEAERVPVVPEVENQEPSTSVTTEHIVSCVPVVSVVHIVYRVCPDLAAGTTVCLCGTKFDPGELILAIVKKTNLNFMTRCR